MGRIVLSEEVEVKVLDIDKYQITRKLELLGCKKIFDADIEVESYDFANTPHIIDKELIKSPFSEIFYKINQMTLGKQSLKDTGLLLIIGKIQDKYYLKLEISNNESTNNLGHEKIYKIDIDVEEVNNLREVLSLMGFSVTFNINRHCTSFFFESLNIKYNIECCDKLPAFLKLEGKDDFCVLKGLELIDCEEKTILSAVGEEFLKKIQF